MKLSKPKYIFVTGGVASSLGKGIISSSLARLLQARGYVTTIQKFDPYINVDPSTLNPYEHGECYVTDDGTEADLDLGHYERFTSIATSNKNTVTTGKIYKTVIEKERRGDYLGKTVQVIPHITDEIKRRIQLNGQTKQFDIIITEIGGTVGDIESLPFIESVRQLRNSLGYQNTALVHLAWVPYLAASGEVKTKPTQHSVKALLENGLQPDVLVLRAENPLETSIKRKIALFCNVMPEAVVESVDMPTIYEVPLRLFEQKMDLVVMQRLGLPTEDSESDLTAWRAFVYKVKNPTKYVEVALVGKYTELPDAYKSINEAFIHAGTVNRCKVKIVPVHSEYITDENLSEKLLIIRNLTNKDYRLILYLINFLRCCMLSIRKKIIFVVFGVMMFSFGLIGLIAIRSAKSSLEEQMIHSLEESVHATAHSIEAKNEREFKMLETLAALPEIRKSDVPLIDKTHSIYEAMYDNKKISKEELYQHTYVSISEKILDSYFDKSRFIKKDWIISKNN